MNIPSVPAVEVNKEVKMANKFIGRKSTKNIEFLGEQLEIQKLSINQVIEVQRITKAAESENSDTSGVKILSFVIKAGAPELADITDSEFQDFPLAELSDLSNAILEFSGLLPKAQAA